MRFCQYQNKHTVAYLKLSWQFVLFAVRLFFHNRVSIIFHCIEILLSFARASADISFAFRAFSSSSTKASACALVLEIMRCASCFALSISRSAFSFALRISFSAFCFSVFAFAVSRFAFSICFSRLCLRFQEYRQHLQTVGFRLKQALLLSQQFHHPYRAFW